MAAVFYYAIVVLLFMKSFACASFVILSCDGSIGDDPLGVAYQPLFADYFHLTHVVIFKWNNRTSSYFMMFLLICGDIAPNPGPAGGYPCGICDFEVADSDKAVCCDLCNKWIRVSCDPGIDESDYDDMVMNPTTDMWFCSNCSSPELKPHHSPAYLKCVCMNVRSIVPKKVDLLAYITAHCYDIIAIIETFLDGNIVNSEFVLHSYAVFRHDRDCHGGGVLLLVHDSISVFRHFDLETDCEIV